MELSLILACHLRRRQREGGAMSFKGIVTWGGWWEVVGTWHANFSSLQKTSLDIKLNHQHKMSWRLF